MDMWIQVHDFSSEDMGNVGIEQAIQAFSTFD